MGSDEHPLNYEDSMDKQTPIKHTEITAAYCEAFGYFPDEIAGSSAAEMRDELIDAGYAVEEIPTPTPRPESTPMTPEEAEVAALFFVNVH